MTAVRAGVALGRGCGVVSENPSSLEDLRRPPLKQFQRDWNRHSPARPGRPMPRGLVPLSPAEGDGPAEPHRRQDKGLLGKPGNGWPPCATSTAPSRSWPGLARPPMSLFKQGKSWAPGPSPGMTPRGRSHASNRTVTSRRTPILMPMRSSRAMTVSFSIQTETALVTSDNRPAAPSPACGDPQRIARNQSSRRDRRYVWCGHFPDDRM